MIDAILTRPSAQTIALVLAAGVFGPAAAAPEPPFRVADGLLDQSHPETLGLSFAPRAESFTIFRPGDADDHFAHGVVLMPFGGKLYAQWQSSAKDEDGRDTHVVYSVSDDGERWTVPMLLAPTIENGIRTSGGWWTDGRTLVAYINVWPEDESAPVGGYTVYRTSSDGMHWSDTKPVTDAAGNPVMGVIEQDPHALPGGRIITAFHMQPGLIVSPWYTDDPLGTGGWTRGRMVNMAHDDPAISREIEPGWYRRPDGAVVMVFRDQAESFFKIGAVSRDRGMTWSSPVLTNVPDSRSKQSAGNLPDGTSFIVSNPADDRSRFPLAILLSRDGKRFDRAFLLRSGGNDLQPQRYEGRFKRVGYSYPKSVLWNDWLYVSYATNKEDAELTRVPVDALVSP